MLRHRSCSGGSCPARGAGTEQYREDEHRRKNPESLSVGAQLTHHQQTTRDPNFGHVRFGAKEVDTACQGPAGVGPTTSAECRREHCRSRRIPIGPGQALEVLARSLDSARPLSSRSAHAGGAPRRIAARGRDSHRRGSRCRRPRPRSHGGTIFNLYYQALVTLITDAAIVNRRHAGAVRAARRIGVALSPYSAGRASSRWRPAARSRSARARTTAPEICSGVRPLPFHASPAQMLASSAQPPVMP